MPAARSTAIIIRPTGPQPWMSTLLPKFNRPVPLPRPRAWTHTHASSSSIRSFRFRSLTSK